MRLAYSGRVAQRGVDHSNSNSRRDYGKRCCMQTMLRANDLGHMIGKVHKHVGFAKYRCVGQGCEAVEQPEFYVQTR
jgi:hypothetical protein